MTVLVVGLLVFLGVHSVRIVADPWRTAQIARLGTGPWKGLYALASAIGLGLTIWGFALARRAPVVLWHPPAWTRPVTVLLVAVAFVLIASAYVPGTQFKARLGHPMLAGVKAWALAHLLSNGRLADVVLFGGFLVWAAFAFRAGRRRDRAAGTSYPPGPPTRDAAAAAIGLVAWFAFGHWLHGWLFGPNPL